MFNFRGHRLNVGTVFRIQIIWVFINHNYMRVIRSKQFCLLENCAFCDVIPNAWSELASAYSDYIDINYDQWTTCLNQIQMKYINQSVNLELFMALCQLCLINDDTLTRLYTYYKPFGIFWSYISPRGKTVPLLLILQRQRVFSYRIVINTGKVIIIYI